MDIALFLAITAVLIFVSVLGIGYVLLGKRPESIQDRVRQVPRAEGKRPFSLKEMTQSVVRIFKPLGEMIPRSTEEMSRQERRLVLAGIRRKDGPVLFYGAKIAVAISMLVLFVATGIFSGNPALFFVLSIFLGALIPDIWLKHRTTTRKENIQIGLPDVLDLTVVCVEAGLGLDHSLMRIGQEMKKTHPDLSDELRLYNLEVNAGKTRVQALRNIANRTEVDDLKGLVAVLIQTDRFGTSIAQSLRVFSDSLRTKRRQRAEERAAKTTIKMVPPLVIFILPAMFAIALGPAVIWWIREKPLG